MTPAQRGCYIELIAYVWPDGIAVPLVCHTLVGCQSEEEWDSIKGPVLACFEERDGKYYHKKLDDQLSQLLNYHKTQRDNGRRGAAARWPNSPKFANGGGNGTAIATPMANHGSSSSSSSSNNNNNRDDDRIEEFEEEELEDKAHA
jgi:uncharacterized protein YdaU (DUF1376 family)